jgi:hypothetical protein
VHLLCTKMEIQINGSVNIPLKKGTTDNITMTKTQKILRFELRKNLEGTLHEETFWTPFEMARLFISITMNSISLHKGI